MTRIWKVVLMVILLTSLIMPIHSFAEEPIKVFINGEKINFKSEPIIENGATYVQFRPVLEKLGFSVNWDNSSKTITASKPGFLATFQINSDTAIINGQVKELLRKPKVINGNTLVWIRSLAMLSNSNVTWDERLRTITVDQPQNQNNTPPVSEFTYDNGMKYKGQIMNGVPHGEGEIRNINGKLFYQGEFKNGVPEGQGKMFDENEKLAYEGQIYNRIPNGYGKGYDEKGKVWYEGQWKDGNPVDLANFIAKNSKPSTDKINIDQINTISDLKRYLEQNYSELDTSIGKTKFKFTFSENTSTLFPWDYWVHVEFNLGFFTDLSYSNKLSDSERETVKRELRDHQEEIAKVIIQAMPDKKFYGGYYYSWYRYPNLKVDLITRKYYSWTNYDEPDLFERDAYKVTKPSGFRWYSDLDDNL